MEGMRRHMYLWRDPKSGMYKYKREYPVELRNAIGKHWFVYSLGTKELPEANKRFKGGQERFDQTLEQYSLHRYSIPPDMKVSLLHELRERFFVPRAKQDITLPELVDAQHRVSNALNAANTAMQHKGEDCTIFSAATKSQQPAKQMAECYRDLLFRMENAVRAAKGEDIIEHEAFFNAAVNNTIPASVTAPRIIGKHRAAAGYGPRLSDAFEAWKKRANPQPKTIADWGYAIRRFKELYGDVHVSSITKTMCKDYRDAISALPVIKSHKTRSLSIDELQKMVAEGKLDMSDMPAVRSVNKMLDGLRAVIQTVIDEEDGFSDLPNPVTKLALKKARKYKRVGFSEEDLRTLVLSPLYKGCRGRNARNVPGNEIIRDALFWIPLLGLFSGARQEEIAQLHLSDVYEDAPVPHYSINADANGKRVKNEESQRLIPIHHELIKIGFLDYVRQLRMLKQDRLFPELHRGNFEQRYAKSFSKRFNAYLEDLGIKPPRESRTMKDFHSYRHLFKTACRRAKIPAEFHHFLTGHVGGRAVGDEYGEYPLETRNECMQQVSFPFLDLSHLYIKASSAPAPKRKKKRLILKKISI